jgi:hypothetical protein
MRTSPPPPASATSRSAAPTPRSPASANGEGRIPWNGEGSEVTALRRTEARGRRSAKSDHAIRKDAHVTPPTPLRIPLATVNRVLAVNAACLCLAGLTAELATQLLGVGKLYGLIPLVHLSYEGNLPTWYSSTLLGLCAVVLALVAVSKRRTGDLHHRHWTALAIVFLYMAIDEAVSIHELLNQVFDLPGILYFGWVIPAGVLVTVFVLSYARFLRDLPSRTRFEFLRAGATYVGGALVVELLLGYWTDRHGDEGLGYGLIDALEESLEIVGITLFLSASLAYLSRYVTREVHIALLVPEREQAVAIDAESDRAKKERGPVGPLSSMTDSGSASMP